MRRMIHTAVAALALGLGACTQTGGSNPFLSFTEEFGFGGSTAQNNNNTTAPGTQATETGFRRDMTVTLANNVANTELNTSLVAWVNANSIRSADQQDALLRGGYVQLTREVRLGSVFTLPPGTFVFNGPGTAGATSVLISAGAAGAAPTRSFTLITPDAILVFSAPPVSCDSVAFYFTDDGELLTTGFVQGGEGPFAGANTTGALKTLAQVSVYQCQPLKPGLFLKPGGGARKPNEYLEGESVRIDFRLQPDANGHAAIVTITGT